MRLIGRTSERDQILACLEAEKNVLLEGPVGVGKTHLALAAANEIGRPVFRIDGDSRYSEQKLAGWFDPPAVLAKGYVEDAFIAGPLVEAMKTGGTLFINELNRLPEGVQNILLPAIDEHQVQVPRLGTIRARAGFRVIATQNPKEFVATSHLSEAILDRFELIVISYPSQAEEVEIVLGRLKSGVPDPERLAVASVRLVRLTREDSNVRRGGSLRAALSVAELCGVFLGKGMAFGDAFFQAASLALPTRIEIEHESSGMASLHSEIQRLISGWVSVILDGIEPAEKKKS